MSDSSADRIRAQQLLVAAILAAWLVTFVRSSHGQVSPEEHAKHHAGKAQSEASDSGSGDMEDMGCMEDMGASAPRELYPSLINLPELTSEKREVIQNQAAERMRYGTSLWSVGMERLAEATEDEDYAAMQEALAQVRQGLEQFETGLSARRALAEGKAPREIAVQWFRREMNLSAPPTGPKAPVGPLGLTWFHFFVMVVLIVFAAVMIWMYFFKMQRAAALLQGLVEAPSATPGKGGTAVRLPPVPENVSQAVPERTLGAPARAIPGKWSGNMRVGRIFQETPDVKTFRLMNPLGGVLPFSYLPGQFLTVTVPIDGKPVRRSYTIASSPTQHDYAEITVKREEEGAVSSFLHNRVQQGDLLESSGPAGSFIFSGRECKCILLIGGGVGITPLMSVIRYLTDRSWPGDIYLLYGVHSPQDFIFREELDYLQRRHPNLRVVVTMSHPEGTDRQGPTGRISKEWIAQSVPDLASRYVHLCGPVPLMEAVKKALTELGVPKERIKTEAFGLALGKPEPTRSLAALPSGDGVNEKAAGVALPTVTFSLSDKSAPLPADKVVLDVADEIGVEIDNSCRVGTCGTCRVKLLSGEVTMAVEEGLEPGDKEQGIILACQTKSAGNVTVEA